MHGERLLHGQVRHAAVFQRAHGAVPGQALRHLLQPPGRRQRQRNGYTAELAIGLQLDRMAGVGAVHIAAQVIEPKVRGAHTLDLERKFYLRLRVRTGNAAGIGTARQAGDPVRAERQPLGLYVGLHHRPLQRAAQLALRVEHTSQAEAKPVDGGCVDLE